MYVEVATKLILYLYVSELFDLSKSSTRELLRRFFNHVLWQRANKKYFLEGVTETLADLENFETVNLEVTVYQVRFFC